MKNLDGPAAKRSKTALLLVDVINDFEFPGGAQLHRAALAAAKRLVALKARLVRAKVPIIYANDNFGRWRSEFHAQVRHAGRDGARGADVVALLHPSPDDYFVLKPMHSAFYQTCLDLLLRELGVERLILGGFATDSCVAATAYDAHQRGYTQTILRDGCAALSTARHRTALVQLRRALTAEVCACADARK